MHTYIAVPNFYDLICSKKPGYVISKNIMDLVNETNKYRSQPFSDLPDEEKHNIKRLNRLLLEEAYPHETPKSYIAIARLLVCSNHYKYHGSVAHTLNKLMFDTTEFCDGGNGVGRTAINLTGIRSYYCNDPRMSRIELYGNKKRIFAKEYEDWKTKFCNSSNISSILIRPVTNKTQWKKYGDELLSSLNPKSTDGNSQQPPYTLKLIYCNY